ncbi:MAG TPA: hypothetical protein VGK21_16440 [Candidatus Angelobacter sp.]|jgi:hypothetical protein
MPITRFLALPLVGLAVLGIGQSGPAANLQSGAIAFQAASPQAPARLQTGSILYAELTKTIDAKKAKVGDPVSAVLTADVLAHGKVVVRHDAKLLGHVTEVQIYTKEAPESRLGIVFDKAVAKGREMPFQSVLLEIRPGERPVVDVPNAPPSMGNSPQGPYASQQGSNIPHRVDPSLNDPLRPRDRGAMPTAPSDIDGLSLSPAEEGGSHTIVSTKRTVKLESGIKIELLVTGQ